MAKSDPAPTAPETKPEPQFTEPHQARWPRGTWRDAHTPRWKGKTLVVKNTNERLVMLQYEPSPGSMRTIVIPPSSAKYPNVVRISGTILAMLSPWTEASLASELEILKERPATAKDDAGTGAGVTVLAALKGEESVPDDG